MQTIRENADGSRTHVTNLQYLMDRANPNFRSIVSEGKLVIYKLHEHRASVPRPLKYGGRRNAIGWIGN